MSNPAFALFRDLTAVLGDDPVAVEKMVRVRYPRFRLADRPPPKQDETPAGRNQTFLRSIAGLQHGPDRLIWTTNAGWGNGFTADPDSDTTMRQGHRVTLIEAKEAKADALRVDRDPCGFCGVRKDFGCEHTVI